MNLYTRTDNNPDIEVLTKEYVWRNIRVPTGFSFDGASSPRIFWFIIPPFKRVKKAACIHDWLCRGARGREERKAADRAFYKALRDIKVIDKKTGREKDGISKWRCQLAYVGVRAGAYMGIGVYY